MIYYTVPVYASQDCLSPRNALCLRCTHCRDMHRRLSEPLTIYHRLWSVFVRSRRREVNLSHNQRATRMTPSTFEQWCRTLALAPSTRDSLTTIRDGHPVRRVTSRAGNVSGMYPSRKMGVTIQFESQKVELWAILVMDHDPDVAGSRAFGKPKRGSAVGMWDYLRARLPRAIMRPKPHQLRAN